MINNWLVATDVEIMSQLQMLAPLQLLVLVMTLLERGAASYTHAGHTYDLEPPRCPHESPHVGPTTAVPAAALNERPFIFVGGPHHSGTTICALLLGSHRDASAFVKTPHQSEGQFLQCEYPVHEPRNNRYAKAERYVRCRSGPCLRHTPPTRQFTNTPAADAPHLYIQCMYTPLAHHCHRHFHFR